MNEKKLCSKEEFERLKSMCQRMWSAIDKEYRDWWCENIGGGILVEELINVISYGSIEVSGEEIEEICESLND